MEKVVFLDRDGTLIREPRDRQVDSLAKLELLPGVISGLKILLDRGYSLVMVSNQDGLGTPRYPREKFQEVQGKLLTLLKGEGIAFKGIFICPHLKGNHCECRKPETGLLRQFLERTRVDLRRSFVLGDRESDMQFAQNLGCRGILLRRGGARGGLKRGKAGKALEQALSGKRLAGGVLTAAEGLVAPTFVAACAYMARQARSASVTRKTAETEVSVSVTIDGKGEGKVSTGIGFFDHMLEQLSKHSLMDMVVRVRGDLHVDEHHTVEDTGIGIGEAVREALGEKRGIQRFGFLLPLDESLAHIALDLGGRSYLVYSCEFSREKVGDLPTELVHDFFKGFCDGLRANLHIKAEGRNDHHKIEAIFKGVARALRMAVSLDRGAAGVLPTTKGKL